MKTSAKKASGKEEELKKIIKEQQKVIRVLSDKRIVKGLSSALDDFKHGRYTVLTN